MEAGDRNRNIRLHNAGDSSYINAPRKAAIVEFQVAHQGHNGEGP